MNGERKVLLVVCRGCLSMLWFSCWWQTLVSEPLDSELLEKTVEGTLYIQLFLYYAESLTVIYFHYHELLPFSNIWKYTLLWIRKRLHGQGGGSGDTWVYLPECFRPLRNQQCTSHWSQAIPKTKYLADTNLASEKEPFVLLFDAEKENSQTVQRKKKKSILPLLWKCQALAECGGICL